MSHSRTSSYRAANLRALASPVALVNRNVSPSEIVSCGISPNTTLRQLSSPWPRNRRFEAGALQRRVCCELDSLDLDEFRGAHGWPGSAMAIALRASFIALALDGPLPSWFLSSAKFPRPAFTAAPICGQQRAPRWWFHRSL